MSKERKKKDKEEKMKKQEKEEKMKKMKKKDDDGRTQQSRSRRLIPDLRAAPVEQQLGHVPPVETLP